MNLCYRGILVYSGFHFSTKENVQSTAYNHTVKVLETKPVASVIISVIL